jgi:uncharacterized protein (DUF362 family)
MNRPKVILKKIPMESDKSPEYLEILSKSIADIFNAFGGKSLLKSSKAVYLKPNAIDTKPFVYNRPEFIECVINYWKNAGASAIYLMENSTLGNYTRIVFDGIGYTKICRRTGAIPIYLDEERTVQMKFTHNSTTSNSLQHAVTYDSDTFKMPKILVDKLIEHKNENLYINLPKLKTHSMGVVTLGIKNQWAFPVHSDRKMDHNYNLHSKLVDILECIQPDFTLIEGIEGTIHGHYPLVAFQKRMIIPFRLLIGSSNVLAADIVGAKIFGIPAQDVPALKIAMDRKCCGGIQGLQDLDIDGDLSEYTTRYDYDIIQEFPPNVNIVKGHDLGIIDKLQGPVVVAGHCAVEEVGTRLRQRLGKTHVFFSMGCNSLDRSILGLSRYMGVNLLNLVPANPIKSIYLLMQAKLHGSTSNVPSLLEILTPYKIKK